MSEPQPGKHHLLFGVPSSTKEYFYQPNCFQDVYQEHEGILAQDTTSQASPYIIFTNVDKQSFYRDFGEGGNHYDTYIPSLSLVLVDMITTRHELAHRVLDHIIQFHTHQFGSRIDDGLLYTGQSSRSFKDREKRPDTSYQPEDLPAGRSDDWPSLVIEAEWSETKAKLERDARWWLDSSNGDVKQVITVAVQRSSRKIVLECWNYVPCSSRDDPGKKVIKVTHRVTIAQENKKAEIKVSNAPLSIRFEDLFLRAADVTKNECYLNLQRDELEYYAMKVWKGATLRSNTGTA